MAKVSTIHSDKQPVRRHFIAEWLVERKMSPVELLDALNDPDRPMEYNEVDKSQVYRWLKGQLPQPQMQKRISEALHLEDPAQLLSDPVDDWLARFFRDKTDKQKESAIQMLKLWFESQKTGTNG